MAQFEPCVEYVLKHEEGFTEDEADPGGVTNFGISLRFLREVNVDLLKRIGIFGEVTRQTIVDLTIEQAKSLYYSEFWNHASFDKIMNGLICKYVFDMAVNHGLAEAIRLTQRACSAAQKVKDYVKDDAILGPKTISAMNQISFMLIPSLIATRAGYMRQLVAVNPKLEVFLDGWLTRCFDVSF